MAFGIDSKYLPAMGACLASIIRNNQNIRIQFHVITVVLPQRDIEQLAVFADQNAIAVQLHMLRSEYISGIPEPKFRRFSGAIHNRLWICQILDGIATRVLYLDADIICLGSIADITQTNLDGKILAAIPEVAQDELKGSLGLVTDGPYFNSGVLYINVELWNRSCVTQCVIKNLINNEGRYAYPDQDALNIVLMGKVVFLDKRWNLFVSHFKPRSDTVFLHYSNEKPWQVWSTNFNDAPFASSIAHTPWAGWADRMPVSRKQRFRHARRLLRCWNLVEGVYWYILASCTPKSRQVSI